MSEDGAWSLFSDLLNDVVRFCAKMTQERPSSLPPDVFCVRVIKGPVPSEALKGTMYERRVELLWRAGDMPRRYREAHSDLWGWPRVHWQELLTSFGMYDLRVRPSDNVWKVELALPPLGRRPVAECYTTDWWMAQSGSVGS